MLDTTHLYKKPQETSNSSCNHHTSSTLSKPAHAKLEYGRTQHAAAQQRATGPQSAS